MELREALSQISHIRQQLEAAEVFRGYRSLSTGVSGLIAFLAAGGQALWIGRPTAEVREYALWWVSAALLAATVVGVEMVWRVWRTQSGLGRQMTRLAVEQFAPCLIVGGLFTLIVATQAAEVGWLLPGVWALLFSLGIFASHRLLPRPLLWSGVWYLATGVVVLTLARGNQALAPWTMLLTFGGGQLLTAGLLYWTLERKHVEPTAE